ncbi:MAG: hypothetical protein ABSE56_19395 [Bryobacteraceae bacterium]|jgi:hypothetical protein
MSLIQVDDISFLDLNALAYVRIESTGDDSKAFLRFKDGGSENLVGEAARNLYHLLSGNGEAPTAESPHHPAGPPPSRGEVRQPIRLGTLVIDQPLSRTLGRNKAWFYRKDENGRGYFLAFVNAKGSCSIRTFDCEEGIFLGKHSQPGNYQDQFADVIAGATEVTVSSQPNLERDCKERLPGHLLAYFRKQLG